MAERVVPPHPLRRGDVYLVHAPLPDRDAGTGVRTRRKWVVLLQDDSTFPSASDVAVLVASSRRGDHGPQAPYEVFVGDGQGFQHASVIDARWPFVMLKQDIRRGTYKTTLTPDVMDEIAEALVVGLCM